MEPSWKLEPALRLPALASPRGSFAALAPAPTQFHVRISHMHAFVHTATGCDFLKVVLFVPCHIPDADEIARCGIDAGEVLVDS